MKPIPTTAAALAVFYIVVVAARPDPAFRSHVTHRLGQDFKLAELQDCPRARESTYFQSCDKACDAVDTEPIDLGYPVTTASGASTIETVQAMLATAWAGYPHKVDLWLRTGCHGAGELRYLTASVELFWPRGIGSIVLVLDDSDRPIAHHLVPNNTRHDYVVRFEHAPCMPARVFNQVSYMFADHYSTADVLVTIDSDCIIHSPVTPRLLFNDGKIRLPISRDFQKDLWDEFVEFFTGPGTFKHHTMVSQPVTFHRSTFAAYRAWYKQRTGVCYVDDVVRLLETGKPVLTFCWMCQLGTFLNTTGTTADLYDFVDVDRPSPVPYQRFSLHTTYEAYDNFDFNATSVQVVQQGLCVALGSDLVPACVGMDTSFVRKVMFQYAGSFTWKDDQVAKEAAVNEYTAELRQFLSASQVK